MKNLKNFILKILEKMRKTKEKTDAKEEVIVPSSIDAFPFKLEIGNLISTKNDKGEVSEVLEIKGFDEEKITYIIYEKVNNVFKKSKEVDTEYIKTFLAESNWEDYKNGRTK